MSWRHAWIVLHAEEFWLIKSCNKQNINKTEFKKLADQMQKMADDFKELWLLRNKPSRLSDNLKLFKQAKQGLEKLAKTKL